MADCVFCLYLVYIVALCNVQALTIPPPPPPPEPASSVPEVAMARNDLSGQDSFYDIIYDDVAVCPLKGNAVQDHIFHGMIRKAVPVYRYVDCLMLCHRDYDCRSINILPTPEHGLVCQLNEFDQSFSPMLLTRENGAVYYDKIHCETSADVENSLRDTAGFMLGKESHLDRMTQEASFRVKLHRLQLIEKLMRLFKKMPTID